MRNFKKMPGPGPVYTPLNVPVEAMPSTLYEGSNDWARIRGVAWVGGTPYDTGTNNVTLRPAGRT